MGCVSRPPLTGALIVGCIALGLSLASIITDVWTQENGVTIGLWSLKEGDNTFSWTETGEYSGDFYYANWFLAVRALMMAGLIIGGLSIVFNLYMLCTHKKSMSYGNVLMSYYFLSFTLMLCAAAVYTCLIPQGIDSDGRITTVKSNIVSYIYRGGYGYSLYMAWVGAGVYLPAAGMAYEGSNQYQRKLLLEKYNN